MSGGKSSGRRTRVLVCCDRALVRAGLQALLEQQNMLVRAERTVRSAVAATEQYTPDAIVVVASVATLARCPELAGLAGRFKVVFLVRPEESDRMLEAVRLAVRTGIRAVLSVERSEALELMQTIRTVVELDSMVFPAAAMNDLDPAVRYDAPGRAGGPVETLTARETEIMLLLAQGRSNAEIAVKLSISAATVRSHVHHLLRKLEAGTRAQAVAIAYDTGLIRTLERRLRDGGLTSRN
ncbi:response regulator transcription factor [Streptomyces sp. MAR4 CNX-425]|uniref:response regulator transcription factor n=1 Tax=Streptomyces sp. MAR4 CNX-425 TaxID=3406343 RepID=UPI003B5043B1